MKQSIHDFDLITLPSGKTDYMIVFHKDILDNFANYSEQDIAAFIQAMIDRRQIRKARRSFRFVFSRMLKQGLVTL